MEGFISGWRFQVGKRDQHRRVCLKNTRMKAGDSAGGGFQFDWELMQKRISEVRIEEEEREKEYSSNWKTGKATQGIAAFLKQDYFRRLKLFGPKLVSGSHTGSIHLFNLQNKKKEWSAAAHGFEVTALDFNGKYCVSGAVDGTVQLMNSKGEPLKLSSEARHAGIVTMAQLAVRYKRFFSGCVEGSLRAWDLSTGELVGKEKLPSGILCGSVVGKFVLLGCKSGCVEVYSADKMQHVLSLKCFSSNVTCFQYDEESDHLVAGGSNGDLTMWNLDSGDILLSFKAHKGPVMSLQWDKDKIVTGGRDGEINVWDTSLGKHRFAIGGYTAYLTTVQFDKYQLITDGTNNVVVAHRFWSPSPPKAKS